MSDEKIGTKIVIELTDEENFTFSFQAQMDIYFDRVESQRLLDLVENWVNENYAKWWKEEYFCRAGITITIRTKRFEKKNMLHFVPTAGESVQILKQVMKHLAKHAQNLDQIKRLFIDGEAVFVNTDNSDDSKSNDGEKLPPVLG